MFRTSSVEVFRRHFLIRGFHFKLLCDQRRVSGFRDAISMLVDEENVVADLGAGIGILSFLAAERAKKVYSVELDSLTHEIGKDLVKESGFQNKISFILDDARTVRLPEKVDVVLCELIDTGCISGVEPQVAVMNHAHRNLMKKGGTVIPKFIITKASLVHTDYSIIEGVNFKTNFPYLADPHTLKRQTFLSDPKFFQKIDFTKINNLKFRKKFQIQANKGGQLNGLALQSTLYLTEEIKIKCEYEELWPPLVFPLKDVEITEGQNIEVNISYTLGGGITNINLEVYPH